MEDDELPECLVQDEEEGGFVDLDLRLVRAEAHPNGTFAAEGRGRHSGRTIGFALELDAAWKPTPIGERQSEGFFYWGTGTVRATGEESNALLSVLAELYQLDVVRAPCDLRRRSLSSALRTTQPSCQGTRPT